MKLNAPTAHSEANLLTYAEVAKHFRITDVTLSRWIAAGKLRPLRLSPKVCRIRREEVERLERESLA